MIVIGNHKQNGIRRVCVIPMNPKGQQVRIAGVKHMSSESGKGVLGRWVASEMTSEASTRQVRGDRFTTQTVLKFQFFSNYSPQSPFW